MSEKKESKKTLDTACNVYTCDAVVPTDARTDPNYKLRQVKVECKAKADVERVVKEQLHALAVQNIEPVRDESATIINEPAPEILTRSVKAEAPAE